LGYFTVQDLEAIHACLKSILKKNNAHIDAIAYCPHFHQPCECRKPKPGMILSLAYNYQINLKKSWMIGDREPDILAGASAGCRTIKLGKQDVFANYYCNNLSEAVDWILANPH
jgi:histidinol-phosphate phosphatase family protein